MRRFCFGASHWFAQYFKSWFVTSVFLLFSTAVAEVVRIDVHSRSDIAGGRAYGLVGPYERLLGRVYFEVDPRNTINESIIDIQYAPLNGFGRVEFSSDFYLIKPKDVEAGNGTVLVDVMNRGRKRVLHYYNFALAQLEPESEMDMGDGFLLDQGFSLLYVGWQFDVPRQKGLMRVYTPVATESGSTIRGLVRSDFVVQELVYDHSLGDRGHAPYQVADPNDPRNVLTVRDTASGNRMVVDRDQWQFGRLEDGRMVADSTSVYLSGGFEPRKIYEVVFISKDPPIAGLGLAAMRDFVSRLKYESADPLSVPAGGINRAIAFGDSQSGRYLRTFLRDGFNEDERHRKVFDGLIAHTGSNARGSFNHRFAQPSRAVDRSYFYPGDQFPFSDVAQIDPVTGLKDGLLEGLNPETIPKVFYTNSSTEYWRLPTALIHTSVDGARDVQHAETSRIYLFAGTQHVPAQLPRVRPQSLHIGNPNDYRWFLRSLLVSMNDWIINPDILPPPSRYPRIADGTLVPLEQVQFPTIGGITLPRDVSRAYRLDYGHQFEVDGIISREPPGILSVFPFLVPQVDDSGNELAGLRSPDLAVPLATYTGWNPYSSIASQGSYIPFPRTQSEREKGGDMRFPIDSRYENRQHYLGLVSEAALVLIKQGYLLGGDLPSILENAGRHWNFLFTDDQ